MDLEKKAALKESDLAVAGFDLHSAENRLKDAQRQYFRAEGAVMVLRELMIEPPEPPTPPEPPAGKKTTATKKREGEKK